jgi:hypothetical protein
MDKLASHSIWAVSIGTILFAKFSLVKDGYISFDHHVILAVGERALK